MLPKQQPTKVKYDLIDKLRHEYSVVILCWYLDCSRSGFYDWLNRNKPLHNKLDETKRSLILEGYHSRPSRGRRQIQMWLEKQYQLHMSLGSIHRYMNILGITSIRRHKAQSPKQQTEGKPHKFPNILKQNFSVCKNQPTKWLTDITYLPSKDGIQYLSCIKDVGDNSIVAYHISNKNNLLLVMDTLKKAVCSSKMHAGIILHSDQGPQYCSHIYQQFLFRHGFIGSMSEPGNPLDNAPIESFFSILKNEELVLHRNLTMTSMRYVIDNFIHFYNYHRPQYKLKKLTPIEFGRKFL